MVSKPVGSILLKYALQLLPLGSFLPWVTWLPLSSPACLWPGCLSQWQGKQGRIQSNKRKQTPYVVTIFRLFSSQHAPLYCPPLRIHCGSDLGGRRTVCLSRASSKCTITKAWSSWFLQWTGASVVRLRTPVFLQVLTFTLFSLQFLLHLIFPLKAEEISSHGNWEEKLMTFRG